MPFDARSNQPDPSVPEERVAFGTSGHRRCAFDKAFSDRRILAITQASCLYRRKQGMTRPLFLGMNTDALSVRALATSVEVLVANGVEVVLAADYTARVVPHFEGVAIPLEDQRVLWQR